MRGIWLVCGMFAPVTPLIDDRRSGPVLRLSTVSRPALRKVCTSLLWSRHTTQTMMLDLWVFLADALRKMDESPYTRYIPDVARPPGDQTAVPSVPHAAISSKVPREEVL